MNRLKKAIKDPQNGRYMDTMKSVHLAVYLWYYDNQITVSQALQPSNWCPFTRTRALYLDAGPLLRHRPFTWTRVLYSDTGPLLRHRPFTRTQALYSDTGPSTSSPFVMNVYGRNFRLWRCSGSGFSETGCICVTV